MEYLLPHLFGMNHSKSSKPKSLTFQESHYLPHQNIPYFLQDFVHNDQQPKLKRKELVSEEQVKEVEVLPVEYL